MTSRPAALSVSLVFYCIGYIIVAASKSVQDVAGGEVLYTIGNDGLNFGACNQPCFAARARDES